MSMYNLPPFTVGLDVLSTETAMIPGSARVARNIDFGRAGNISRREGIVPVISGVGMHSVWSALSRELVLFGKIQKLHMLDTLTGNSTEIADMKDRSTISYTEHNGVIYLSNESTILKIRAGGNTPVPIGTPAPANDPQPSAVTTGALIAGTYSIVFSYIDMYGEESGSTNVAQVELPVAGGILLSNLPMDNSMRLRVYVTSAGGETFRLAGEFQAAMPSYVIGTEASGNEMNTLALVPMPAGQHLRAFAGRLYVAKNDILYNSKAFRFGLRMANEDYIQLPGSITFIEPVQDGIYVGAAGGVYFLDGMDVTVAKLRRISDTPAIQGSSLTVNGADLNDKQVKEYTGPVAIWLSEGGYMAGLPGGNMISLQSDRLQVPIASAARSAYVLRDGMKQVLTTMASVPPVAHGIATDSII